MRWSAYLCRPHVRGNTSSPGSITILGGGLTGLAAAHFVRRSLPNSQITVIEGSSRFGGWLNSATHRVTYQGKDGSEKKSHVVLEGGPRSIRPQGSKGSPRMLKMIRDIGLEDSILPVSKSSPSAKNRYILDLSAQQPSLLPVKPSLNPFSKSPMSLRTVLAAATEPFARSTSIDEDESVDSFLRRRFGLGIASFAGTMLHGIYAASSTDLSARSVLGRIYKLEREYGSVVMGMMRFGSSASRKAEKAEELRRWAELGELGEKRQDWAAYGLKGGLSTLTDRLAEDLRASGVVLLSHERVTSLEPDCDEVAITTDKCIHHADHIISTISSHHLFPLLRPSLPNLSANPFTSVGVVNLVFPLPPTAIHPKAFGYLVPRSTTAQNPASVLGVVFDSTAMPGLDPGEVTKMTVMMGGPYWSTYPADGTDKPASAPQSPEALVGPALEHLRSVFSTLQGVEPALVVPRLQADCIPTYAPGHCARMDELSQAIEEGVWSGKLSLVGASYFGASVNDCVWSAQSVAEALGSKRPTGLEWASTQ